MADLVTLANSIASTYSRIKSFCQASAQVSVDHEKRISALALRVAALEAKPSPVFTVTVTGTPVRGKTLSAVVT